MEQHRPIAQPWIKDTITDSIFILSPPFVALLVVMLFPAQFKNSGAMPIASWVILIVMIDVAHVYSTLYRTYFKPSALQQQHHILVAVPLFCYIAGVILYTFGGLIFWRGLAYLAVFHFIRQQYGFMRLYSRKEHYNRLFQFIDNITIYTVTIYPILYWHFTSAKKNFNWFVDGDFILFQSNAVLTVGRILYFLVVTAYLVKEAWVIARLKTFNLPKNLIILGTLLSWYLGIIYYNGDMAFTTLNVVSHGIPYMALIWVVERRSFMATAQKTSGILKLTFNKYYGVLIFAGLLILFAYVEEGLWDGLVWKEHGSVFKPFSMLPAISGDFFLAILVPFLALPQSTHYVLDGFIWRTHKHAVHKAF